MTQINGHRTLVSALDAAWAAIQHQHTDVPGVVLTLGSGALAVTAEEQRPGHFAACRWQHAQAWIPELIIGGDGLRRGPLDVMATLLHEAAHGLAFTRQIKDTSRQNRYHNGRYRTLATELGLDVAETRAIGWSATTLPTGTADRYRAELAAIERALLAFGQPKLRRAAAPRDQERHRCPVQVRATVPHRHVRARPRPHHLWSLRRTVRRRADPGRAPRGLTAPLTAPPPGRRPLGSGPVATTTDPVATASEPPQVRALPMAHIN